MAKVVPPRPPERDKAKFPDQLVISPYTSCNTWFVCGVDGTGEDYNELTPGDVVAIYEFKRLGKLSHGVTVL